MAPRSKHSTTSVLWLPSSVREHPKSTSFLDMVLRRIEQLEAQVKELRAARPSLPNPRSPVNAVRHSVQEEMVNARKWRESIYQGMILEDRPALQRFFDNGGWMPPKEFR